MRYFIYKTTNLLDGKYYIGCHQTNDPSDGYLGSGKHLIHAIKKYGKQNFKFEILHEVDTKEEMFAIERDLVNESLINNSMSYNLKIGGSGGNPGITGAFSGRKHTEETKEKMRQARKLQKCSEETRRKLSENSPMKDANVRKRISETLTGIVRSEDHKKKIAAANVGKILVNNGEYAKRVTKEELPYYESMAWKKGGMPRKNS